jgi:hypothetical protein
MRLLPCCLAVLHAVSASPHNLKRHADFESVRTHLALDHSKLESKEPNKYFHEATFGSHYDGRFADKPLKYNERAPHLKALIQTYLDTMNNIGAETWLMHGSLLGWYWNRKVMPWDSDIDVTVSERTMHHLAAYYNMTMHHYKIPGIEKSRDFLLEINSHYLNGTTTDKSNKIDARWVDTDTGLFIDITTLRRNLTAEDAGIDGAMMIKDNHHYLYDDIYPLRETDFEGAPAKVPFAYAALLEEEYGAKSLTVTNFANHKFDAEKQEWLPQRLVAPIVPALGLPWESWLSH